MAIKQTIVIDVQDNGLDQATKKANALAEATERVSTEQRNLAGGMKESGIAVLENGGAMGLLNDATGGYAMMVKDAVEASWLFTKSQKVAAMQQKAYTFVVGASTGAMKTFRIALAATGIGAAVVALGLLIANFGKVKDAVYKFVPPLRVVGQVLGNVVEAVTDFIGVTSDASRALDDMVAKSEASLKRSEHFLEANGDKYDEYTRRKMQANIDYNKKVKELNEDEELSDKEKLKRIADFREKANREIERADKDRADARQKAREEEATKAAEAEKTRLEKAKAANDKAKEEERARRESILKIIEDYAKKEEDLKAKTDLQKLDLEEQRALKELDILKASEEEKQKVREFYANRRKELELQNDEELAAIKVARTEAERSLAMDQKEWEIENETDPQTKYEKQRELLEEQNAYELEKLQKDIDNAKLSATERAKAEMDYAKLAQDSKQALANLDAKFAEEQKERDNAVAQNRVNVGMQTAQLIAQLAGEGSAVAKGVAVAQATIDTYKGAVSAYSAMSGIPIVGPALGAVAAGAVVAAGVLNVKKILATKPVEKGAPSSGGGGASAPQAPSFNLVQGTGSNQIAESLQSQKAPVKAYVVSSDVSSAQSLDRNIVENSKL